MAVTGISNGILGYLLPLYARLF